MKPLKIMIASAALVLSVSAFAQSDSAAFKAKIEQKNAEALKMASIETAKESERGIVDIETLKHTNQTLIDTLDEVMKIQEEGRSKRASAEVELQRIENEMRTKIMQMAK